MLTKRVKIKIIETHQVHNKDTGSAEVQIAMLTRQIEDLTKHLKKHAKDNHSRRGLLKMVGQRRRLMEYLKKNSPKGYAKIAKALGLKK
ncbi:MAG: 30S ribosomal protein S15 [Candidatus Liptonbacteria bacterium]